MTKFLVRVVDIEPPILVFPDNSAFVYFHGRLEGERTRAHYILKMSHPPVGLTHDDAWYTCVVVAACTSFEAALAAGRLLAQ